MRLLRRFFDAMFGFGLWTFTLFLFCWAEILGSVEEDAP